MVCQFKPIADAEEADNSQVMAGVDIVEARLLVFDHRVSPAEKTDGC